VKRTTSVGFRGDRVRLVLRADLHYDKPVGRSEEGMPLGNGRMGSLVGTVPTALKLQINRVDVFATDGTSNTFPERHTDYCGGCGFVDFEFRDYAGTKLPFSSRWNWIGNGKWENGRWAYTDRGGGPYGPVTHIFSRGAKIAYLYWLRYEYTMDMAWLRERAYPMLKGVAEFYRNYPNVKKEADGKYHIHHGRGDYDSPVKVIFGGLNMKSCRTTGIGRFLSIAACALALAATAWAGAASEPNPAQAEIRTPKPPDTPRINGPAIFGVRPGNPFLYRIPATGARPMEFSVESLPAGLQVDARTGQITGSLKEAGAHVVTLRAKNTLGTAEDRKSVV
jgi:hypothetical protein